MLLKIARYVIYHSNHDLIATMSVWGNILATRDKPRVIIGSDNGLSPIQHQAII